MKRSFLGKCVPKRSAGIHSRIRSDGTFRRRVWERAGIEYKNLLNSNSEIPIPKSINIFIAKRFPVSPGRVSGALPGLCRMDIPFLLSPRNKFFHSLKFKTSGRLSRDEKNTGISANKRRRRTKKS